MGVKRPGREADYSPQSSAEIKGNYPTLRLNDSSFQLSEHEYLPDISNTRRSNMSQYLSFAAAD
jgi:hypothetical protein